MRRYSDAGVLQVQAKVSAESARWIMWATVSALVPPMLTIMFLGSYSDVVTDGLCSS